MALGERLGFIENDSGLFGDSVDNAIEYSGMANVRRRRKNRKNRGVSIKRQRHKRSVRPQRTHATRRKAKSGKRPYPHWLKKYWFKKKR